MRDGPGDVSTLTTATAAEDDSVLTRVVDPDEVDCCCSCSAEISRSSAVLELTPQMSSSSTSFSSRDRQLGEQGGVGVSCEQLTKLSRTRTTVHEDVPAENFVYMNDLNNRPWWPWWPCGLR